MCLVEEGARASSKLAGVGVVAAVASAIAYGIRPIFLEFGLDNADLPITSAFIGAVAAFIFASVLARFEFLRTGFDWKAPSLWFFVVSGILQAIGFLALNLAAPSSDVTVAYPVTSTAPICTLGFTALLSARSRIGYAPPGGGVVLVVAGVIGLWLL